MSSVYQRESITRENSGLFINDDFFYEVKNHITKNSNIEYCLIVIDIEHFKLFNEINGRNAGDEFLLEIASNLKNAIEKFNGVAGYLGADDFCVILPNKEEVLRELRERVFECINDYGRSGFQPSFGEYVISDITESIEVMYDRAVIALSEIKGNYAERVSRYRDDMMTRMQNEYMLQSDIKRAINEGEIIFYLQPKCNMCSGKIVGAEALVRWRHKDKGMISPGIFIPVLEKNGSIIDLDCYIWESVFKWQKSLIKRCIKPVPVSVNVSRIDIYFMDVPAYFDELLEKYKISPDLIEIELTESAYIEGLETITNAVQRLQSSGFKVLMDDFGSGYSSLNMLKNINIDILKIDMKFLDINENSMQKGLGILETVIDMARMMGLPMITEGIENQSQVDALRDMGCIYAQGYYFYRPICIEEFETYLEDTKKIDFRGIRVHKLEQFHIREFLDANIFSDTMVNNILGAIAFYEVNNDKVEIVRVNEQYYRVTGIESSMSDTYFSNVCNYIYEADRPVLMNIFERAGENTLNGADGDLRYLKPDGSTIWLNLRCFFLNENGGVKRYYGSIVDVTENHKREKLLIEAQHTISQLIDISENNSFSGLSEIEKQTAFELSASFSAKGIIGLNIDGTIRFADDSMLRMAGCSSYDEFVEVYDGKFMNTVYNDDKIVVTKNVNSVDYEDTITYRMLRKDGLYFWVAFRMKHISDEYGNSSIFGICSDITQIMEVQTCLAEKNTFLLRQNQELSFLNNDMPGGYHRCSTQRGNPFLYMSERFLEMLGYTEKEVEQLFDNKFMNMVHPDDRKIVSSGTTDIAKGKNASLEYRMLSKNGYIWVIDQTKLMEYDNQEFFQGVIVDVTETVELRNNMKMLIEHTPTDIILLTTNGQNTNFKVIANGLFRDNEESCEQTQEYLNSLSYYDNLDRAEEAEIKSKYIESIKSGKNYSGVFKMNNHSGEPSWIHITCKYIGEDENGINSLCICSDITKEKQKENELAILSKKLEITLDIENVNSWEWNFEKNTFTIIDTDAEDEVRQIVYNDFPKKYTNNSTEEIINNFISKMSDTKGEVMKMEFPTKIKGKDTWCRILGRTINDEYGKPVSVVGSYRNITDKINRRIIENRNIKMLEFIKRMSMFDFTVNLTQQVIYNGTRMQKWREITGCKSEDYDEVINFIAKNYVVDEYREKYINFSNRDRLINNFNGDVYTESIDYEVYYKNGTVWRRNTVYLIQLDDTGDIYEFMFIISENNPYADY